MSKKKSWLCVINRFFFSEPHHHQQQKRSQRRRIWLVGRLKRTRGLHPPSPSPPPAPPPPPPLQPPVQMTKLEAEKKQRKWETDVVSVEHRHEKDVESLAATKIQTAYRGYLARKALRALKGFVRLQAIIRGRAVRRQAMTTLKCLQAIVNIQSQVCSKRGQMALAEYTELQLQGLHEDDEFKICGRSWFIVAVPFHKVKTMQMEISKHRRLDGVLLPKENEVDIILKNEEAILGRQRSQPNANNHRISADSEQVKVEGHLRNRVEQYVNDQVLSDKEHKPVLKHLKLKNTECLNNLSLHRRSFHTHRKHSSSENSCQSPGSPTSTPAYMAATESARAKARSTSSPRPRPVLMDHAYSDGDSPYKHKQIISPMCSTRSEMSSCGFSRVSNKSSCSNSQLKSPTLKGPPSAVRSNRDTKKDVSLDSENLVVSRESRQCVG